MAKLTRIDGGPGSGPCDPRPEAGGLRLDVEGAESLLMPYGGMSHDVGGYEGAWLIVTSPALPGIELWLLPAEVVRLAGLAGGVPDSSRGVFGAMVAGHSDAGKRRRGGRILAWGAAAAVLAWLVSGGFTTLLLVGMPRSAEASLGAIIAESVVEDSELCTDPALVGAVEQILVRLVESMEGRRYEYRVRVLRDPEINAFALPGGEIFFNSGLLERAESEHEVAAVMGHEVQHIRQRHGLRSIVRSLGITVGVRAVLGDIGEGVAVLADYAGSLTSLKFGRDQERASDVGGIALMTTAGFDPQGAVNFFGKLAEDAGEPGTGVGLMFRTMTSTHPASSERTDRLRELAAARPSTTVTELGVDWQSLRSRCSAGETPGG